MGQLEVCNTANEITTYRKSWKDLVDRMGKDRMPTKAWNYTPIG
jgi:hypothetical protein